MTILAKKRLPSGFVQIHVPPSNGRAEALGWSAEELKTALDQVSRAATIGDRWWKGLLPPDIWQRYNLAVDGRQNDLSLQGPRELGRGGMAVVYKAEDTKLKRFVALKFLRSDVLEDEEHRERFLREAQAAAALDHSNICTVYEIDEVEGETFIAMALIEGPTVKDKIAERPLKLKEALDITIQSAHGLQAAHEKGIVHRDIKSANLMLTAQGQVKVMDFGLAQLAERSQLTKTATILGTPAYMSPEQAQRLPTDRRTDIWSLGVVIYEMVTGRLPFEGERQQAVLYAIARDEPDPITALRVGVPVELDRIVLKAMAKSPDERYQHVEEMAVDLRSLAQELESGKPKILLKPLAAAAPRDPIPDPSLRPAGAPPATVLRSRRALVVSVGLAAIVALAIAANFHFGDEPTDPATTVATPNSIAVLPLENLSGDPEQEYFSDGMTDALISDLGTIGALRVISRTSVMRYKESNKPLPEIARELNVSHVVEGSVLRAGDQVRITTRLIDALNDRQLWSKRYQRPLKDVLALQSDVAQAIAREIEIKLKPEEQARLAGRHPVNPEAQDLYLKGRFYERQGSAAGRRKAIDYYQKATEVDPRYALAYASLADAYMHAAWGSRLALPPKEAMAKAKAAALRAVQLDDTLDEVHSVQGTVALNSWDWSRAKAALQRALALNPSNGPHTSYAFYLMYVERDFDGALAQAKRARELNPLSLLSHLLPAAAYHSARRYDQAIEQYQKTLELDPNYFLARNFLGKAYADKGMYEDAIVELKKAILISGVDLRAKAYLAYTYALAGERGQALKILNELNDLSKHRYVSSNLRAVIHTGLGDNGQAFEWLESAYQERDVQLLPIKVDPVWDPLRSDPRFQDLLKKMGLEDF